MMLIAFFFFFFLFAPQAGNGLSGLTGGMKLIRRFSLPPTPPTPIFSFCFSVLFREMHPFLKMQVGGVGQKKTNPGAS